MKQRKRSQNFQDAYYANAPPRKITSRTSRVTYYVQYGDDHHLGTGENRISVKSQRFIVFEVDASDGCKFTIEERWTDWTYRTRKRGQHPGYSNDMVGSIPRECTVALARLDFLFGTVSYVNSHFKNPYTHPMIRAFETAAPDVAEDIFHRIFSELVLEPEAEVYFNNLLCADRKPGFLEVWVPEYFGDYIRRIIQHREDQVKKIMEE